MKNIILIFFLLVSISTFSQYRGYDYYENSYVNELINNNKELKISLNNLKSTVDSLLNVNQFMKIDFEDSIKSFKETKLILNDSIRFYKQNSEEIIIPFHKRKFFDNLEIAVEYIYIYAIIPIVSILILYILFNFGYSYIFGVERADDNLKTFRRIVSWLLPFFISSYVILIDYLNMIEVGKIQLNSIIFSGDIHLIIGVIVGIIFIAVATLINFNKEFQINLVIFYSSLILFSLITAFIIFESFSSIRIIFGFIIGSSLYIFLFGIQKQNLLPKWKLKGR